MVGCLERRVKSSHFVDDASQRPYVTFVVVVLLVDLLWAHVVGSAHVGACEHRLLVHHSGKSEIADLGFLIAAKEDIAWL